MTRLEELKREKELIYPKFMFIVQCMVEENDVYKKQMFMDIVSDYSKKITEYNNDIEFIEKGEKK